ncbi:MAG TPA: hypothetical protein VF692_13780, partial [Pyrinomonadaceae bacterium]
MRSNTRANQTIEKTASWKRSVVKTFGYLTLGMEIKQWTAMALICLMLLPIFTAPVGAATAWSKAGNTEEDTSF